jgi:hypothetical protein
MYREQIVKLCHDPPLAGHRGIERTIEKVKSRYYWRGISKDVSAYVKGCTDSPRLLPFPLHFGKARGCTLPTW